MLRADANGPSQGSLHAGIVGARVGVDARAASTGRIDDDIAGGRQRRPIVGLQIAGDRGKAQRLQARARLGRTDHAEDDVPPGLGLQREGRADVATTEDGDAQRLAHRGKKLAIHSAGVEPAEADRRRMSSAASAEAC